MNTEKIEKLKKGLTNSQIPESLREKIRQQISRLEAEDKANEPVTKAEIQKIEDKIEDAVEVAEKKEATAKVAKARTARTPRAKRTVAPKARTTRKPRAKKVVEPKTTTGSKNTAMSLAKEIRKEGEKWSDAVKRAGTQMKKGNTEIKKSTNTELKKLLALVKTRKELKGITGTDLKRDSKRKAKPLGKRVSEDGNVYYEYRENRTDRLAPNYPKNAPLLADGGGVDYYEQLTVYVVGVGTLGSGTSMRKAIDKAREYEKKNPNAEVVIVDEKYGDEYDSDGNFKNEYATGGGVDNLPTSLKTRLKNLKGRVTISKAQALKAYELHSERGMGGSTIGYEMFDAKNKRDSETFGDLAIDLGRHYSKFAEGGYLTDPTFGNFQSGVYAGGGGINLSDDKYKYDLMDIGQFSLPENVRKSDAEYYKIGKEVVEKEYDGNLDLAYNMVVRLGNKERFADGGYNEGIEEDIDMTDDYVLRVNKGVQPEDRASMREFMAKTNESREAMAYELGGKVGKNYEIELFWKGLSGNQRKIGKYVVSEKTLDNLEEQWRHILSIDVIDETSKEPISWYNIKRELFGIGREKNLFELGGAFMQTDLAGNTGGGTGGLNAKMALSGVSGTHYTGLVGETGALSSGEMFMGGGRVVKIYEVGLDEGNNGTRTIANFETEKEAKKFMYDYNLRYPKAKLFIDSVTSDFNYAHGGGVRKVGNREYSLGRSWTNDHKHTNKSEKHEVNYNRKGFFATGGAVMANQQIIDDASQHYVNYYLNDGASAGMFKDGGAIENQYKGRSPMDVWDNLTRVQKAHFLHDHMDEIAEVKNIRKFTKNEISEGYNSEWIGLDDDFKIAFAEHIQRGQYARGGGIRTINGREYSTGRNWTNDHRQHNKGQDYEVPMSKRR